MRLRLVTLSLVLTGLGASFLHAAEGPVLLFDNFATLSPGWGKADERQGVIDNKLVSNLPPKRIRHSFYDGLSVGNADIRVKVAQIEGNTDQSSGIVFWSFDHENYYVACVTSDGQFSVGRLTNGKWLSPVARQPWSELHQGLGQENDLRVLTCGRIATVYVNGKQAVEFRGYPPEGKSKFGLYATSGDLPAKWAYSQLTVRAGPTPSLKTVLQPDASLLLADDFGTLDPAWGSAGNNLSVRDGKLWLTLGPRHRLFHLYQGRLFDDVDVTVKLSSPNAWTDQLPGLIFWGNGPGDYCAFSINLEGEIYAGQILERKWKGMNILRNAKSKLRTNALEINELRVITAGNSASLYINGQKAHSYTGTAPKGGSRIGLLVETNHAPASCAFSEFRVRTPLVTPETSSSRTDGLLLTDDFRALHPSWGAADEHQAVQGNQLLLTPPVGCSRGNFYTGNLGNIDLQVNVTLTKGGANQPAGTAFWQTDGKNYYAALVYPDGNVSVARLHGSIWLHPVPKQLCEAVHPGPGQTNAMRVVTCGSTATVHINEKPAFSFRGFPPLGGGGVGLIAESGTERCVWAFSDLVVAKGPESPPSAIPPTGQLFADDFSVLDPAWSDPRKLLSRGDHSLIINPNPRTGYTTLYEGALFGDADVSVKVSQIAGQADQPAGIVLWARDFFDYFLAAIRSDGNLTVLRNKEGKFSTVVPPKPLKEVMKGLGQVNELRVVIQGKAATVHVNGAQVASVETDAVPESGCKIGFLAGSGDQPSRWAFSHLEVQKPRAP